MERKKAVIRKSASNTAQLVRSSLIKSLSIIDLESSSTVWAFAAKDVSRMKARNDILFMVVVLYVVLDSRPEIKLQIVFHLRILI